MDFKEAKGKAEEILKFARGDVNIAIRIVEEEINVYEFYIHDDSLSKSVYQVYIDFWEKVKEILAQ